MRTPLITGKPYRPPTFSSGIASAILPPRRCIRHLRAAHNKCVMRAIYRVSAFVMLLLSAASLNAVNMRFLKDAPLTRLNSDELKVFREFLVKTLDETPQGTTVEWTAPKTVFNSKITPQKSASDGS